MPGSVSEYTDDFPTKYTPENDVLYFYSTRGLDGSTGYVKKPDSLK